MNSACTWWVLAGQIVSVLSINSTQTHWVNAPLPPVSVRGRGAPVTDLDLYVKAAKVATTVVYDDDEERVCSGSDDPRAPNETPCNEFESDEEVYYSPEEPTHDDPREPQTEPLTSPHKNARGPPDKSPYNRQPECLQSLGPGDKATSIPTTLEDAGPLQLNQVHQAKEKISIRNAEFDEGNDSSEDSPQHERSQTYDAGVNKRSRRRPIRRDELTYDARTTSIYPTEATKTSPKRVKRKTSEERIRDLALDSPTWEAPWCLSPDPLDPAFAFKERNNERSMWSDDADDGSLEEMNNGSPDHKAVVEGALHGPELEGPTEADPWDFPVQSVTSERYPPAGQSLRRIQEIFPENFDDEKITAKLRKDYTLDRFMNLNPGPRERYDAGTTERMECRSCYDEGSENDYYGESKPEGLRYLPHPRDVPNGLLAALEIIPYANNEERLEHHLMAYGVTLATRDRQGNLRYYNGDANIRITEPPPGITVQVPNRRRTEKARRKLFQKGKIKRPEICEPRSYGRILSETPAGNHMSMEQMSPDELEGVLDQLLADPIMEDEEVRTYTIQKGSDGVVIVRPGFVRNKGPCGPPIADHAERDPDKKDKEVSWDEAEPISDNPNQITVYGSDPPTPDHAPEINCSVQQNEEIFTTTERENGSDTLDQHEKVLVQEALGHELGKRGIRRLDTNQPKPPLLEPQSRDFVTTDSTLDGKCACSTRCCPKFDATILQQFEQHISHETLVPQDPAQDLPSSLRAPCGDQAVPVEWCEVTSQDGMEGPGLMAAAHLVELRQSRMGPGEHSFVGFNATIVANLDEDSPSIHQGHVFVHLYDTRLETSQSSGDTPDRRPPPEGIRVFQEQARQYLRANDMMPDPQDSVWRSFLKRNRFSVQQPLNGTGISVLSEFGDVAKLEDAVEGLRALRHETCLPKSVSDTETTVESDIGEHQFEDSSQEYDEPCSWCLAPLPIRHTRTLHQVEADDLPELIKTLDRPESMLTDEEGSAGGRGCDQSIPPMWVDREIPTAYQLVPMDVVKEEVQDVPVPVTPPNLYYPTDMDPCEVPEANGGPADAARKPANDARVPTLEEVKMEDDEQAVLVISPNSKPAEVKKSLNRILANLDFLLPEIDRIQAEEKVSFIDCMASLGLLQIVYEIAEAKEAGGEMDPEYWKKCIVEAMLEKERKLTEPTKMEGVEEEPVVVKRVLSAAVTTSKPDDEDDIDMVTHQDCSTDDDMIVQPPSSPVEWYPDVSTPLYIPASPGPDVKLEDYRPKSPELDEIKNQLADLEERIDESTRLLKERVNKLELQMFDDGCLLTSLKWEQAELQKKENKARANRKKTYRRSEPTRGHRYPARNSMVEDKWMEAKSDIAAVVNRIKALEERVDRARQEVDQLKSKIDKVLALVPYVEELGKSVDVRRKEQSDMNSLLLAEIADLRNSGSPAVHAQIKQHAQEIATLTQNYHQLYTLAASLLYSSNHGYSYRQSNYSAFGPPNLTPEKKVIGGF